ncbi:Conserved protein containing a Zn-ribbon-like motif, possibly RNA-binding [Microlunatus sagamiharensis]|uniref:Conserved protein containing a Zn-ribbon-like motif, possibly RNA-binding n=1 Tax=Microlunatus sagamiharensis TaxID=546874 RepID=A0A1H2MZZ5_9ACTN|nr:Conserved protein containing a Zn-ribbon-like motif, possibly RNA-binding [Microlunatus sagamiharensis]
MAVVDLLNTLDQRTFLRLGTVHQAEDRLTTVEALEGWFGEHGLPTTASPADLGAARTLRDGLRAALLETLPEPADAGTPPEPVEGPRRGRRSDPATDVLRAFPLRLRADDGRLRLAADTGSAGLDAVVETVATAVADGRWKRLKLCASEDCHWAYLDTSRSGGGRWCSMDTCGNRHKTRAYRQRKAG